MKKILMLFLAAVAMLIVSFSAGAVQCDSYKGTNENAQNYAAWASVVKSYLHNCSDGKLMRVQSLDDGRMLIEYYNDSFERTENKTINLKYPLFGGLYAIGDDYFVLTGQNNLSEKSDVVCFAVTKYDKNWNEIATANLSDCNTTEPFVGGSARFTHSGNYLLIRTCHKMYKSSDGENHQANVTIQIDIRTMEITDSYTKVTSTNYGYVSHSFNQFIKIDSDKIVALDHGDAYPRSIVLIKYKTSVSSGKFVPSYSKPCDAVDMFEFEGNIGDNDTGCSVGGFELSSDGYIAAFNSIQKGTNSKIRDIYISYLPYSGTEAVSRKLTSYSSAGVSTPQLVKMSNNKFMVLWYYNGKVNYCTIDGEGNLTSDIKSFEGSLSDCQPVIVSGNLVWYVWTDDKVSFYSISTSDITKHSVKAFVSGHNYVPKNINGTSVELRCADCGAVLNGTIPSKFNIFWEYYTSSDGTQTMYSSQNAESYHPGEEIGLWVKYSEADYNDFVVTSSDESVAKINGYGEFLTLKTLGEGSAKITVKSKYNPEINTRYTIKVAHNWQITTSENATCTKEGKTVKNCSICSEAITEIIPALGHSYGAYKITKQPTCTAQGTETATCSRCNDTKTQSVAKIAHTEVTVKAVAPTCTKQGKTAGKKCSVCDRITVEQEAVPALGHDYGEYKITKKPTCTAQGTETATCSRCNDTKTQSVAKIAHTEVTVKAVAPTCTKQGKTAGKKCSVCDRITVEQEAVPALGHDYGEYKITKKPTCTAQGTETATCSRCNDTKTQSVAKIAHTEVTVKAVAPTCTKQGKTAGKKCSVCDKITLEQESVEALGHDLGSYEITKDPTCTAKGEKTAKCTRCTYTKTADVAKVSHTEVTVKAVAPTCTKQGKTAGKKCSVCDKITLEQESVEALGHQLGNYEITKEPTCTAKGEKTAKCTRCTYTKTADVAKVSHTEVTVKAVAPTCTKQGKTAGKKCSVCDKITLEQESVEALGHQLGNYEITKEPTCTSKGEKTAKCTRCTYTKTADVAKVSHTEVTVKAVAPTCTKQGKTAGKKCSVCDKVILAQESITALGHSKKTVVITKATTKANGKKSTVCKTCGKSFGENRIYRIQRVTLAKEKYTYDGKAKKPNVIVIDYNKDQLVKGTDYTVTYQSGRKAVGTYCVTVNFKGKYSGKVTLYFKITLGKPADFKVTSGTSAVNFRWSSVKGADGYQIYYSTSEKGEFKKLTGTTKTSFKKTGLKAGKTYYFKVRAYKKTDSGTVYGSFSTVKSVKIK